MEDRSQHGNLRVDGLKEVENETWEQIKQILKSIIQEKLEIEYVNIQRAHRVGNTSNTSPRTVVSVVSRQLLESVYWFGHPKKEPKNSSSTLPKCLFYHTDKFFFV